MRQLLPDTHSLLALLQTKNFTCSIDSLQDCVQDSVLHVCECDLT